MKRKEICELPSARPFAVALCIPLAMLIWCDDAAAIKRRAAAPSCEDKIEQLKTDLRLREGELVVVRGQLRAALRKLGKCNVSLEIVDE